MISIYSPPKQHHSFFRNLPPSFVIYNVRSVAIGIALHLTSERKTTQTCCQGLTETSSSLEASFGLLLYFWPFGFFSPLLHPLGCEERMCLTPHPHVCYDGTASEDKVWIPSCIHQTLKHRRLVEGVLLLRHPRLCSQSERVDRYYHCYFAADILRDRTWKV